MRALYLIAFTLLFSSTASAQSLLCDALKEEATYEDKTSYRYLFEGHEGYVFRSKKGLKSKFEVKPETLEKFSAVTKAFKAKGIDFVIVMPPTRALVHPDKLPNDIPFIKKPFDPVKTLGAYNNFIATLKSKGVLIADFSALPIPHPDFYYKRDHHWSPEGAKLSAQYTADVIKALPSYTALPKQVFKTTSTETQNIRGSFEKYIEKKCESKIEDQLTPLFETAPENEMNEDTLFGDKAQAQIVLVGTSNTTEPNPSYANYAGWLRETLSTDIHNVSISGDGIEAPITTYVNSEDFLQNPPKIIVWEVASHYNFDKGPFDRIFKTAIEAASKLP